MKRKEFKVNSRNRNWIRSDFAEKIWNSDWIRGKDVEYAEKIRNLKWIQEKDSGLTWIREKDGEFIVQSRKIKWIQGDFANKELDW